MKNVNAIIIKHKVLRKLVIDYYIYQNSFTKRGRAKSDKAVDNFWWLLRKFHPELRGFNLRLKRIGARHGLVLYYVEVFKDEDEIV